MKRKFQILTASLLFFYGAYQNVYATDLTPEEIILPPGVQNILGNDIYIIPGTSGPIGTVVANINVLAASSYKVIFEAKSLEGGVSWSDEQMGYNLLPGERDTIYSNNWSPLSTGYYAIKVTVEFSEDIDNTNNSNYFFYIDVIQNRNASIEAFKRYMRKNKPKLPKLYNSNEELKATAYIKEQPVVDSQKVGSADTTELNVVVDTLSYLVYMPYYFSDKYMLPAEVFLINAMDTSSIRRDSINWWVTIDGVPFLPDTWSKIDSGEIIAGPTPEVDTVPDINVVAQEVTEAKSDSACALIVTGKKQKDWENSSFTKDLDFIEGNLMHEQLGPQLSAGQVVRIGNATKGEIENAIDQMKDKCDKIYFYYTGHGWKGGMSTNDPSDQQMTYLQLAQKLSETHAKELCVVIDACYSGSAEGDFRIMTDFETTNLTLITSSHSQKTSFSRNVYTAPSGERYNPGFFTWELMKCFGDPMADKDGDGKTSLEEAYWCVMEKNPVIQKGHLTRIQNPQLIVNRVVHPATDQIHIKVPDLPVELDFDSPLDEGAFLQIEEHDEIVDTTHATDSIYYLSKTRYYSFDLKDQLNSFNVDLTFTYDFAIDSVDSTGVGDIGMVKRDTAGLAWEKIKTIHLPDLHKVKALGQTGFSDFTFAKVYAPGDVIPQSILKQERQNSTLVKVYPNPAQDEIKIRLSVEKISLVQLSLVDLSGRELFTDVMKVKVGMNTLNLNFANLNDKPKPGIYVLYVKFNDLIYSERILIY